MHALRLVTALVVSRRSIFITPVFVKYACLANKPCELSSERNNKWPAKYQSVGGIIIYGEKCGARHHFNQRQQNPETPRNKCEGGRNNREMR